jgi:hypothetical protein
MTVRANKPAFNIREKLKELTHSIGLKGRELMSAATVQEARDFVSAGRKNLIINGDFRVSQRGDYSSTTTVVNNGYYLDRWKVFLAPGVTTGNIQRLTTNQPPNAPADSYSVRMTATNTASGDLRLSQPFENPTRFPNQTVTLSAWVKTNSPNCRLYYFVGGSYNSDDFSDPVNGDGNWHYVSFTTTMRSNITHFYPIIGIDGDASASVSIPSGQYFEITQVQLEVGKNATDFEHRSYGEELALCKRYYQRMGDTNTNEITLGGYSVSGTTIYHSIQLPVEMRAVPTLTQAGTLYSIRTDQPVTLSGHRGRKGFGVAHTTTGTGSFLLATNTSNYFILDAEV